MATGDDQLVYLARQHGSIRCVIVSATADAVGEVDAVHYVFFGHHVFTVEKPRLAHAGLRREVHHIGLFKAGHVFTSKIEQAGDTATPF